jgi:hypothetical protein
MLAEQIAQVLQVFFGLVTRTTPFQLVTQIDNFQSLALQRVTLENQYRGTEESLTGVHKVANHESHHFAVSPKLESLQVRVIYVIQKNEARVGDYQGQRPTEDVVEGIDTVV